ncbi:KaiC/GvpD/RAD55 family RecA-like ATPase [Edaphobacter lichenicola]|uniref:KaiC/GvpD/RAD55 family RecA-like ATPase n=1 Tax=Tunturiibacter lichenicola TaxID=2051959 RepID=A0A7W8J5T4_9BACT|nr:KaiC/GvpD/RAD55 family RecA-like ATPase [Edaphobacter lichenicola]
MSNDALNTGVLCDELCAIDIDVDNNQELVSNIIELARQLLGPGAPIRYRGNSTRVLTLYRVMNHTMAQRHKTVRGTHGSVDFLSGLRQFVAYGEHESGAEYRWDVELKTIPRTSLPTVTYEDVKHFRTQLAELMGEIASHVVPAQPNTAVPAFVPCAAPDGFAPMAARLPATKQELAYAQAALNNEVDKLCAMRSGSHRNNALNIAAHSLGTMVGSGWIDAATVVRALFSAAISNGYVAKRGEEAAKNSIVSGLNAGMEKPRDPLASDKPLGSLPGNLVDPRTTKAASKASAANSTAVAGQPKGKTTVELVGMGDVVEKPITWLWPGYLPSGALTLLAGQASTGKSTLSFGLAATVSNGGHWPDGTRCATPGTVLIWSGEDDLATTVKPRLMAAGAAMNRVGGVKGTIDEQGMKLPFDPSTDMGKLREAATALGGVALLIIDPIVSAVTGDMNKANDVRRSLQAVVDFASEFGCAIIGITHFAKNTQGKRTTDRVLGSQAFAALARMVLVTAKEEDSDERVFTRDKTNITIEGGGFHYTIEAVPLHSNIVGTRVVWGGAVEGSSRSILSSIEGEEIPISGKKSDEARNFLYRVLANGAVPAKDVQKQARAEGIAEVTLRRTRESMNIVPAKIKGDFAGPWMWELPHHVGIANEMLRDIKPS